MTEVVCAAISAAALIITAAIGRSNCELCDVIALAVTGGHTNGNVEAAQKKVRTAKEAYEQFLRDTAAHAVSK